MAETFIVEETVTRRWRVTLSDEVISMAGEKGGEKAIEHTACATVYGPEPAEDCITELLIWDRHIAVTEKET